MPIYIQHRVNLSNSLRDCDVQGGVEIDVRSCVGPSRTLHLSHDPWNIGVDFPAWLHVYATMGFAGPLVINTKEDGLEGRVREHLHSCRIDNYFFLDTTAPTLARCLGLGWGAHMAIRLSHLEPPAAAEPWFAWSHKVGVSAPGWLWVDCFGGQPLAAETIRHFTGRLRLCLVSPELQGQPLGSIERFRHLAQEVDAVCTKYPDVWQRRNSKSMV